MVRRLALLFAVTAGLAAWDHVVTAQDPARQQRPTRDRAAGRTAPQPAGTSTISGHVLTADTGRPVRRARVLVSAAELPGGRAAVTDDQGFFELPNLPAGRYTVNASKNGFVALSYGQRRPRQGGAPLQLAEGQELSRVDFRLPRGGVIAGHIYDDAGEPLVGTAVRVMRYEYAQGAKQLVPAGGGQTDDQGAYRIWGLNPGDYYVSATVGNLDLAGRIASIGVAAATPAGRGGRFGNTPPIAAAFAAPVADVLIERVALAPTYFPGVAQVSDAQPVTVGVSSEMQNVNFAVLLVRTALVRGRVAGADGASGGGGNITLIGEGSVGRGPGTSLGGRIGGDGSFSIGYVPPGHYTLRARAGSNAAPQFAQQSITVGDGDTQDLAVVLAPGATLTGTITFQATTSATVPDASQIRLVAPAADFSGPGGNDVARIDREGRFAVNGVMAGRHWLRPQGTMRGWMLKSVTVDGRDVTDIPFDVQAGQTLSGISVVFSDRVSEVNGTLTDDQQQALTDFTLLAFPADTSLWRPQARQIMTTRPDQNGKFQLRGLPPGDYYLAPVDPVESGEWFEPAFLEQQIRNAARLSLGEGDVKTQDFKLANP